MSAGPRLLALDTAAPVIGAALGRPGQVDAEWSLRCVRGADAALLPAVQQLLDQARGPLDAVVVSVGPGAFTGLRVGVATALGLAVARGVPVVPVSALAARAALAEGPSVLALLDARKGRVYAGHFDCAGPRPVALGREQDAELHAVLAVLPSPATTVAVGEGARAFSQAVQQAGLSLSDPPERSPAPAMLGMADLGQALDPGEVALRYLRPADAIRPRTLGQRVGHRGPAAG